MDLINRMENACSIADGLKPNEIIDGKVIYDLQLHLSEAMDLVKDLTILSVTNSQTIKKFEMTLVPKRGEFKKVAIYAKDFDEASEIAGYMRSNYENSFVTKEL